MCTSCTRLATKPLKCLVNAVVHWMATVVEAALLPLGKPYPEQVDFITELMGRAPLNGKVDLVADASGVGRGCEGERGSDGGDDRELFDEVDVAGADLERVDPRVQVRDRLECKWLVLEIGQRPSSPEIESRAKRGRSLRRLTRLESAVTFADETLEAVEIEPTRPEPERVARRLGE